MKAVATSILIFSIHLQGLGAVLCSAQDVPHPNVIFFMADDMGIGDTSAYQDWTGNQDEEQLHTPNMERLARMGVRFTDAHTPTSRCTGTRYGLLTGRYPWRNRLKHWVLFGSQGDPMIEADRPTIASMLKSAGYRTAIVGKWHVGLRYRNARGEPAAGWEDADLSQPLHTTPLDHGFDFARFTSRSHGTSGPNAAEQNASKKKLNGPGHIHGRIAMAGQSGTKELIETGPHAYILSKLGGRHYSDAREFLDSHLSHQETKQKPFFLYYASNSNHGPYTPDEEIEGRPIKLASRSKSGQPMSTRYDFIHENDVALGLLLDWLERNEDPRNPGKKLIDNTIVIFTSDNGAEIKAKTATGPIRSHKGSAYEGGHRVPYIVSWPAGQVGNGVANDPGLTNATRVGLIDTFATLAEVTKSSLPWLVAGQKGAEDSHSVLAAWRGEKMEWKHPIIHNDHSEAKQDRAACAVRMDDPSIENRTYAGKWKLLLDSELIRFGRAKPVELFNLDTDPMEQQNLIENPDFQALVDHLCESAETLRNIGGSRYIKSKMGEVVEFDFTDYLDLPQTIYKGRTEVRYKQLKLDISTTERIGRQGYSSLYTGEEGLGVTGVVGSYQVDNGESLILRFDQDVIVESFAVRAGKNGTCGGTYRIGYSAPLAIYCVDADNDAQDQRGNVSDIGQLNAGEALQISSAPAFTAEPTGTWMLRGIRVRKLQ